MYIFKPIELSEDESYYKRFESWFISNEQYVFYYDEIVSAGYKTSLPIQSQYLLCYDLYIQTNFPEIYEIRKNNGLTPYNHTVTINESLTFLKVCYPVNHKHEERKIHIEVGRFGPRSFRNKEQFEIIFRNDYFSQLEGETKVELSDVTNNFSLTLNTTSNTFDDLRVIDSSKKSNFRYFTQPLTLLFDDSEIRETEQIGVPVEKADYQINKLIPNNSTMHIGMVLDGFIYWQTSINYRPLLEEDFIYDNFTGMVYKYTEGLAREFSFLDHNLFFQGHIQILSDYIEQEDLIGYRFGTLDYSVYSKISNTDDPLALKFLDLGDNLYVLTEPLTQQEQIEYKNLCDLEYGLISESIGIYSVFIPALGARKIVSPVFGPTSLTSVKFPSVGPTSLTSITTPMVGPTSLTPVISPTVGPTSLTHLASPMVGPTSITHLASPAVGPTSLTSNGLWTPSFISTELWLDSDDLSTITKDSSDLVSIWADKSGNGNNAIQSSNALQPSDINLGDGIEFDGSNDGFILTNDISENDMSLFVVMEGDGYITANNSDSRILFFDKPSNLNFPLHNLFWDIEGNLSINNRDVSGHDGTKLQILEFSKNGTNLDVRVNGVSGVTATITQGLKFEVDRIGIKWDSSTGVSTWDGNISEIIATTSTTDREKIEGYLAHKWGLEADLASTHPYKLSAPTPPPAVGPTGLTATYLKSFTINHPTISGEYITIVPIDQTLTNYDIETTSSYNMPPNLIVDGNTLNYDLYSDWFAGGKGWNELIALDATNYAPTISSVYKSAGWVNHYPQNATGTIS